MKTAFAALILTVSAHAALAATFSVTDWAGDVNEAARRGDAATLSRLLNREGLENRVFSMTETKERIALRDGRKLFAEGKYDQALARYDVIKADAPEWLEALEEKGWTQLRRGDYEKALAQTKTLLSSHLRPVAGSEPFLLQALAQLKVCDYAAALETNALFKDSQKERLLKLQSLADTARSADVTDLIARADEFPLTLKTAGKNAPSLPRQSYRDLAFQKSVFRVKTAEAGLAALEGASRKVATIASKARETFRAQLRTERAAAMKRMARLAAVESDENAGILQKLNLIEVDTIERVHIDKDTATKKQAPKFAKVGEDELMFIDDGDTWIDELDSFQVRLNACKNVRRKM